MKIKNTSALSAAALALVALGLTSCLQVEHWILRIDLEAKRGELHYRNITSDGNDKNGQKNQNQVEAEDFDNLVRKYLQGEALGEDFPRWRIEARDLYEEDGELHGVVKFTFETPADVGLDSYDAARPYRFCPRPGQWITAANARWRDNNGCVIWPKGATKLELEETAMPRPTGASLLPRHRDWKARRKGS